MLVAFIKGIILGFSVAAPVGPIGLLCIRRSLALSSRHGFATGLGAATADALYGTIAGFGLTYVSTFLVAQQGWARLIGGVFLAYLGVKIFVSKPADQSADSTPTTILSAYLSSLFLTVTNPLTILSFVAAFAGLGLASTAGNYVSAAIMVSGVFLGSAAWWLILSTVAGRFRAVISARVMTWINRTAGGLLCAFAIGILISLIKNY